jgi:hypothetical protein
MSTITLTSAAAAAIEERETAAGGLLRRVFDAIIEARTRSARRRIAVHLESVGDAQLADLGFSAADIASIRAGEPVGSAVARRAGQM